MIYFKYTVCDMCGKKYRRKMDMLQHKKDDHLFITKEEVAALERLKETVRHNYFSIVSLSLHDELFATVSIRQERHRAGVNSCSSAGG